MRGLSRRADGSSIGRGFSSDGFTEMLQATGAPRGWSSHLHSYEPDVLASDLEVVFAGLNPACSAVRAGHSFSHPSNRFWSVLHLAESPLRSSSHETSGGCSSMVAVSPRLFVILPIGRVRSRRRNSDRPVLSSKRRCDVTRLVPLPFLESAPYPL